MPVTPSPRTERSAEALVDRLSASSLGMMEVLSVYIGDRLGLYRSLRDAGPATARELARRVGMSERYAREWLEQQAVADLLDIDDAGASPDARRYALPAAYADAFLDPDSPASIAPFCRSVVAIGKTIPALLEAYRSGRGVDWDVFGPDMIEAQGDSNRPWLRGSFAQEILPAIPAVAERLARPGARVADVACGVGWAGISVAAGYPEVTVHGFDLDPSSIELATANAASAGVADRVTFTVRDAADPAAAGRYDLAVVIEAVHDLARPIEVLRAIRGMLKPGGLLLVADEKTEPAFAAPGSDLERTYYGFSVLTCLPAAMGDAGTAGTGTVMRESTFRGYAEAAGFRGFEALAQPTLDTMRFYLLTP